MYSLRPHQQQATEAMEGTDKGQVIMATGSGKTMCMIDDTISQFHTTPYKTHVIVSPRILLTLQLSSEFLEHIDNAFVCHVHSGHTPHFSTTNPNELRMMSMMGSHKLIFTTYHSLHRIVESGIHVDTVYCDESHNSTRSDFYPSVKHMSINGSDRFFTFTATPRHSCVDDKPGMNNTSVYGEIISSATAKDMVSAGYILPPQLISGGEGEASTNQQIVQSVKINNLQRTLVCMRTTSQLIRFLASPEHTELRSEYDIFHITSKLGARINGKRVKRHTFFRRLREHRGKFILLHVRILSEGINLSNLDSCVILRSMNTIDILQTIGRVIRLGKNKTHGLVVLPTNEKYLSKYLKTITHIMSETFDKGKVPIQFIKR